MPVPTAGRTVQRTRPAIAVTVACIALFTDMLIYGLAIPVLPLLPATVHAGAAATGVLFAGYAAAMILITPLAGRLVDRFGARRPLLVGLVGLASATVLFAVGSPYSLLVLARVLQGGAAGMSWVAGLSLIAAVTPVETRGRSMGLAMSMVSLGVLIGPPLAGLIVEHFGVRAPFYLAAALAFGDGVARVLLVRGSPRAAEDPGGALAVLRVRGSASVLGTVVLGAGTLAVIEPVLPLHLLQQNGTSQLGIGLLFAISVVTGALINPLVGSRVGHTDARVLIGIGGLTSAAALVGVAVSHHTWQVAVSMLILGGSNAFLLAPAITLIGFQGRNANPPTLGGAYAAFNLAYAGGLMIGPLLAGIGTDLAGFTTAITAIGAFVAVVGFTATIRLPTGLPHDQRPA